MKTKLLGCSFMIAALAACTKFEDGPSISLRSKNGRLAGDWKAVEISTNGVADNITGYNLEISFTRGGDYNSSESYQGQSGADTESGTWEWKEDSLILKDQNGVNSDALHVVRLTNSEFWIDETDGSDVYVYKFESK